MLFLHNYELQYSTMVDKKKHFIDDYDK